MSKRSKNGPKMVHITHLATPHEISKAIRQLQRESMDQYAIEDENTKLFESQSSEIKQLKGAFTVLSDFVCEELDTFKKTMSKRMNAVEIQVRNNERNIANLANDLIIAKQKWEINTQEERSTTKEVELIKVENIQRNEWMQNLQREVMEISGRVNTNTDLSDISVLKDQLIGLKKNLESDLTEIRDQLIEVDEELIKNRNTHETLLEQLNHQSRVAEQQMKSTQIKINQANNSVSNQINNAMEECRRLMKEQGQLSSSIRNVGDSVSTNKLEVKRLNDKFQVSTLFFLKV
eukprot:TRINITY_DN2600_c0_g1_i2.p1 TRINITY_DN2600_c0_g1~~TRINITY_DN2600_c0_g1_i2.p1  ORF type:complete len:291 (-),score=52.94 TRINITY_DN2600_c0_g1_i2:40-912(-)